MSLKSKIEAVVYASEEPVTLAQLVGLLGEEARAAMDAATAKQEDLPLESEDYVEDAAESAEPIEPTSAEEETAVEEAAGVGDQHPGGDAAAETSAEEELADEPEEDAETLKKKEREAERAVREYLRVEVDKLIREYADNDRGIEVREVAGGYRMGTKPEYHDAVRGFVKSLRPPLKLSLQALETLAVVAYKQPVTAAEISEIRGVDSSGVLGGLMTRKLIQTAGRKQVVGRPMLYKTTKEFLVRFGLKDLNELPSIEEFEKMAGELNEQEDLPIDHGELSEIIEDANARGDAEAIREELAAQPQPDGDGHTADDEEAPPEEVVVEEAVVVLEEEPAPEDGVE